MATEVATGPTARVGPRAPSSIAVFPKGVAAAICLWLAAAAPALAELSTDGLRELETLLSRLGFDPGPIDGAADEQTASAIRAYQTFAALPVDGSADEALLAELRGVADALASSRGEADRAAAAAPPDDDPSPGPPPRKPTPPAPETPREAPAVSPAEAPTEGTAAVQLASTLDPDGPERHWSRLRRKLPGLLRGRTPETAAVDLGERGIFHRLLTGPFPDRTAADGFCAEVKRAGEDCRVVSRPAAAMPPGPRPELRPEPRQEAPPEEPPDPVALALAPGGGLAELGRAAEAFRAGDCEAAEAHYTTALEQGGLPRGEAAAAFNNRGRCRFERALYTEAVADHGAAIELRPDFAAAHANRGRAHAAAGDHELARDDMRKAHELGFRKLGSDVPTP